MSAQGGILALDLSTHVGVAWGARGDAAPRTVVWNLPSCGLDIGRTFAAFENELLDAFTLHKPSLVVMEAPLPPQGQTHALTMRLQIGLAAITACNCYRWELPPPKEIPASTARAGVLGSARFPKGKIKETITAWVRGHGIRVADHNAADAVVLWLHETGYRTPRQIQGRKAA